MICSESFLNFRCKIILTFPKCFLQPTLKHMLKGHPLMMSNTLLKRWFSFSWRSVTLCDIMWHSVKFWDIIWDCVTFCDILWHSVTLCDIMWHSVTLCDIVWWYFKSRCDIPFMYAFTRVRCILEKLTLVIDSVSGISTEPWYANQDDYIWVTFDHFWSKGHLYCNWGSSKNWLKPKTLAP